MADIQISSAVRTTLGATQRIQAHFDRSAEEISSGRKKSKTGTIRSADIAAKLLSDRAGDLLAVKDTIGQGVSKTQVAVNGLHAIDRTLEQLKAVAQQYEQASTPDEQAVLQDQFNVLSQQIDNFSRDASLGGTQLISATPDNLTIPVSDSGSAVTVTGQASDSATLNFSITDVASIDAARQQIRAAEQSIGTDASTLQIREEFSNKLVNQLQDGAAKLTQVDLNEAAANALSAQTRSQLSFAATALAAKSDRTILQLF